MSYSNWGCYPLVNPDVQTDINPFTQPERNFPFTTGQVEVVSLFFTVKYCLPSHIVWYDCHMTNSDQMTCLLLNVIHWLLSSNPKQKMLNSNSYFSSKEQESFQWNQIDEVEKLLCKKFTSTKKNKIKVVRWSRKS